MADYNLMAGNLFISIIVWLIGIFIIARISNAIEHPYYETQEPRKGWFVMIFYTCYCLISYGGESAYDGQIPDLIDLLITSLVFLAMIPIHIYEFLSSFSATHILLGSIIILLIIIIVILLLRNNDR